MNVHHLNVDEFITVCLLKACYVPLFCGSDQAMLEWQTIEFFSQKSLGPKHTVNSGSWFSRKLKICIQACLPKHKKPSHPWLLQPNDIHSPKTPTVLQRWILTLNTAFFL
jgi:hypothetical protein